MIGDDLDMIASGPTVADPTTFADAWSIVEKYNLLEVMPPSVRKVLEGGLAGKVPETMKPAEFDRLNVRNHLVGTNRLAALAGKTKAEELGYKAEVLTTTLTGTTDIVAENLADLIRDSD